MKIIKLLWLSIIVALIAAPAFTAQSQATEKVRILFSSNLHGQTTPCG